MGIFQLTVGCLSICKIAINNNNNEMTGRPPFPIDRVVISWAPKNNTTAIKTENMGKLLKVSPAIIIANKEGIPIRFTNTLEDLFVVIITMKLDEKFTGTLLLLPKG